MILEIVSVSDVAMAVCDATSLLKASGSMPSTTIELETTTAAVVGAAEVGCFPPIGAAVVGSAVVGPAVVGAPVVGAPVVGAAVVGPAVVGSAVVGSAVLGAAEVGCFPPRRRRSLQPASV